MISNQLPRHGISLIIFSFLLVGLSCKSSDASRIKSKGVEDAVAGERQTDFAVNLIAQIDELAFKIQKIHADNKPSTNSPNLNSIKNFAGTEFLSPYSNAASAADKKQNREFSRALSKSLRNLLAAWYHHCKKSTWAATQWAYPLACRDYSKIELIDDISDFEVIADIIKDIEVQRDMPFQQSIYYETIFVNAANERTLQDLIELCSKIPLSPQQSDLIVARARAMPKPELVSSNDKNSTQNRIDTKKLASLAEIAASPADILRDVMIDYQTEIQLFMAGKKIADPTVIDEMIRRSYQNGRRSPITDDFYKHTLSPLFAGGTYSGKDEVTSDDFRQSWMPKTHVCAALKFKERQSVEMRRFFMGTFAELAINAGSQATNGGFNLQVISKMFNVPLLDYLTNPNNIRP
jgi:hypothetical protein